MTYVGFHQRVALSLTATALVFAVTLGYWGVGSLQSPSANESTNKCVGGAAGSRCNGTTNSIVVTPAKSAYATGESIAFTLQNDSGQPLTLANGSPFVVAQGDTTVFAPPAATQALVPINPGESLSWSWNQSDTTGRPVKAGSYTIRVAYSVNGSSSSAETTVSISAPTTVGTSSFSVAATQGAVPFKVSLSCTGTESGFTVDFGDGVLASDVSCPITLAHTYTVAGSYSITESLNRTERARQLVTVIGGLATTAGKGDGKSAPTKLGRSGPELGTTLAVATIISALATVFILRRLPVTAK